MSHFEIDGFLGEVFEAKTLERGDGWRIVKVTSGIHYPATPEDPEDFEEFVSVALVPEAGARSIDLRNAIPKLQTFRERECDPFDDVGPATYAMIELFQQFFGSTRLWSRIAGALNQRIANLPRVVAADWLRELRVPATQLDRTKGALTPKNVQNAFERFSPPRKRKPPKSD